MLYMKKCEYCAKEISYHEQYCSDECHINANKYYEKAEKFARPFYIISTICVIAIPVFILIYKGPGSDYNSRKLCSARHYDNRRAYAHRGYD